MPHENTGYIAILETGVPPLGLDKTYGDYPKMFENALSYSGLAFKTYRTLDGELPFVSAHLKGVLITGSPAGVYEDEPWILTLIDWLRGLDTDIPTVGICFGHQAMAKAWGGEVVKSPKGWGVGLHEYHIHDHDLWRGLAKSKPETSIKVAVTHQDQVVTKPQNSVVLAGSEFTPNGALYYTDRKALSFQCHPEFCPNYATQLLNCRRGTRIDADLVDHALETLKSPSNHDIVLDAISNFLAA